VLGSAFAKASADSLLCATRKKHAIRRDEPTGDGFAGPKSWKPNGLLY
jgi:hypothetical protein